MPFAYFWNKQRQTGDTKPLQEYASAWHLAKHNKFSLPAKDPKSLFSGFDYAKTFHVDLL